MHILTSACAKIVRNGPASPNYPAKAAAMCMECHEYAYPPPSIPPFLLAQNLYLKIVPTDNLLLKSDDDKVSTVVNGLIKVPSILRKSHRCGLKQCHYLPH